MKSNLDDLRVGVMSMMPPVDREDELRSRAEYYTQYARENILQESDTLRRELLWDRRDVERFVDSVRRGDEHRKWLLRDMQFDDPYHSSTPASIQRFEQAD